MNRQQTYSGYLVVSLDVELGWGLFDMDRRRARDISPHGQRERAVVERLLDLFDEHGIVATWALVGHLFYNECEACVRCPVLDWQGKYRSFDEIYATNHRQWYGADLVAVLLARRDRHEIAFHGYTHTPFDETRLDEHAARLEIEEWLRMAARYQVVPRSVVFPRNIVGFRKLFAEAGFVCFRGNAEPLRAWRWKHIGKLVKTADHILGLSRPPVYSLDELMCDDLVDVRSSEHLFSFSRTADRVLDRMNLHTLRMRRIVKAMRRAAAEQKVVHLWAHPWEFASERDFAKLRYVLDSVQDELASGRLKSVGMAELAGLVQHDRQRRSAHMQAAAAH